MFNKKNEKIQNLEKGLYILNSKINLVANMNEWQYQNLNEQLYRTRTDLKEDINNLNIKIDSNYDKLDKKIDSTAKSLNDKMDSTTSELNRNMGSLKKYFVTTSMIVIGLTYGFTSGVKKEMKDYRDEMKNYRNEMKHSYEKMESNFNSHIKNFYEFKKDFEIHKYKSSNTSDTK